MATKVEFTQEAIKVLTVGQRDAIDRMCNEQTKLISCFSGGFDLPPGYITFQRHFHDSSRIFGGISPEGDVST